MKNTRVPNELEELEPRFEDQRDEPIVEKDGIKDPLVELKELRDSSSKEDICRRRREREREIQEYGPLHHAAACGNTAYLNYLLTKHTVNSRAKDKSTPLHLASRHLQLECVKLLLDQGDVEVDAVDDNGLTPLHSAGLDASNHVDDEDEKPGRSLFVTRSGSALPVVVLLIQKGAKLPQDGGKNVTTFIHRAVARRDVALLKHAMDNSWDILRLRNENNCNVLHISELLNDLNMLKMILSHSHFVKESLNETMHEGIRPLCAAALDGWVEGVRELLQAGAPIVGKDVGEYNVLHWAALGGSSEVIEMLLDEATKAGNIIEIINEPCSTGETPIFLAVRSCDQQCVYNFLKWGADAKRKADGNYNLIHQAVMRATDGKDEQNPLDMLHYLLEYPELKLLLNEVTTKDINKGVFGTPVNIAAWAGDLGCVKVLFETYKADVTEPFNSDCSIDKIKYKNWTPLHSAAYKGNVEVIEYIVKTKPETLKAITVDGWTPLHVAARNKQEGSVKCLLKLGASLAETTSRSTVAVEMILAFFSDPQKLLIDIFDSCIIDSKDSIASHVEIDYSTVMPHGHQINFDVLIKLANREDYNHKVIDTDELILHPLMKVSVYFTVQAMMYTIFTICSIHSLFMLGFYFMTVCWKNYDSTHFIDFMGLILLGFWIYFSLDRDLVTEDWRQLFSWRIWPLLLCLLVGMAMTVSHLTSIGGLSDYSDWVLVPMYLLVILRVLYYFSPAALTTVVIIGQVVIKIFLTLFVLAVLFIVLFMLKPNIYDPLNDFGKMVFELLKSVKDQGGKTYIGMDVVEIVERLLAVVPLVATYVLRIEPSDLTKFIDSKAKKGHAESIVEQAKLLERLRKFWFEAHLSNPNQRLCKTCGEMIRVYHSKSLDSKEHGSIIFGNRVWKCVADWYIKQEDPARKKDKDLFSKAKGVKQSEDSNCTSIKEIK